MSDKTMSLFDATMIAEGQWDLTGYEAAEETALAAWQLLVDTGAAWQLQGSFGRTAEQLIEEGLISCGT